ncbi:MAG: hypothetical protein M3Y72_15475 [Acidobacteriota bacterium]|nr:hypothetical protein [Acidobacteriota bacterium]
MRTCDIARRLGIAVSTVKTYCKQIRQAGGFDAVLRPSRPRQPVLHIQTQLVRTMAQEFGLKMTARGVSSLLGKIDTYATELGLEQLTLSPEIIKQALRPSKTRALFIRDLKTIIANQRCESDKRIWELGCTMYNLKLPSNMKLPNGNMLRIRISFPTAVLYAAEVVARLDRQLDASQFDLQALWACVERQESVWYGADEFIGKQRRRPAATSFPMAA